MKHQNLIYTIPLEWFENRFSELTSQMAKIQQTLEKSQEKQPDEFMTRKEVLLMLKCDASTLYAWTKASKLQAYLLGGKVYYKRSQIESVLEANTTRKRA